MRQLAGAAACASGLNLATANRNGLFFLRFLILLTITSDGYRHTKGKLLKIR
jgi:hypothetical protein